MEIIIATPQMIEINFEEFEAYQPRTTSDNNGCIYGMQHILGGYGKIQTLKIHENDRKSGETIYHTGIYLSTFADCLNGQTVHAVFDPQNQDWPCCIINDAARVLRRYGNQLLDKKEQVDFLKTILAA